MSSLPFGEIMWLKEINPSLHVNKSIRTHGKIIALDVVQRQLTIEQDGQLLVVNTELLDPEFIFVPNTLHQFIGELEVLTDVPQLTLCLKARIVRNIDGMDLKLYEQAVGLLRNHLIKSFAI